MSIEPTLLTRGVSSSKLRQLFFGGREKPRLKRNVVGCGLSGSFFQALVHVSISRSQGLTPTSKVVFLEKWFQVTVVVLFSENGSANKTLFFL